MARALLLAIVHLSGRFLDLRIEEHIMKLALYGDPLEGEKIPTLVVYAHERVVAREFGLAPKMYG